jgi:hypothetical protein
MPVLFTQPSADMIPELYVSIVVLGLRSMDYPPDHYVYVIFITNLAYMFLCI